MENEPVSKARKLKWHERVILVTLLLIAVAILFSPYARTERPFDSNTWKDPSKLNMRWRMCRGAELMITEGMITSKSDAVRYFGRPDGIPYGNARLRSGEDRWIYNLGKTDRALALYFDGESLVRHCELPETSGD